jgi:phosphate uptake regulator
MHIRKLVKAGQTSHTVSLPKGWLDKNKLGKGDTLYIHELASNELRITPSLTEQPAEEHKAVTISVDGKGIETIQREITAAYVNNANTIDLVGSDIAKHAADVRRMLHDFVALEIAEQTPTRISAKDLLNLHEISVEKSLARMDIIVRTMLQDCITTAEGKDLSESVLLRDYDVNRLYFLLVRLLKSALASPAQASRVGVASAGVLTPWMLVHHLEHVADTIKSLCSECATLGAKQRKDVTLVLQQLKQDYLDAMKAVHEKNKQLADEVARRRQERQSAAAALKLAGVTYHCSTFSSILSDIARLVIDKEN